MIALGYSHFTAKIIIPIGFTHT